MKKRTIKNTMQKLIILFGGGETCHNNNRGREEAARRLGIHPTYVWKIAKGKKKPGKHLGDAIVRLYDDFRAGGKK